MDKPNVLAPRFEYIPEELTSRAQWVIWKAVYLPDKGKYNKIPINARTLLAASSTDPATWSDFETAKRAYLKNPAPSVNPEAGYAGVGFVLCDDDPFCGIDLDHVATLKAIDKAALDTIKMLDTYAEVSPSGTGIRLFAVATLPPGGRKKGDVECYESGRFLTVTGRRLRDGSGAIESRQAEVEAFHAAAFPPPAAKPARAVETGTGLVSANDTDLLALATGKAKNGDKIAALYSGSTAGYAGASEADFALCAYLAFWTGDDPARLDRLFRVSGLMRDKWDERRYSDGSTYGEMTVRRAIAGCTEFYKPRTNAPAKPKSSTVETEPGFGGEPEGDEAEGLPTVVLTDRPDRDISGDAWSACLGQNEPPQLFSRGRGVAYLGRDSETKRLAVQEVDQEKMLHRLRRVADFVTVRQTKGGELHTHATPPLRIARDMLLDTDNIGTLPALRGVVYAPMIAPDGSLIAAHGYHACARVYVAMEGLAITLPDKPTQDDAKAAYARLFGPEGVFGEFPYGKETDRTNAAALLLTPFLRAYVGGNVPMAIIEAPEKGTGKSLLTRNLIRVSDPSPKAWDAPTGRQAEDAEAEWNKLLGTALREAPPVLFFDNVRGLFASSALEALLTSPDPLSYRVLGTSTEVTVWGDTLTICATSNNAEANRDMARRSYVIRIDAEAERPEDRTGFRIPNLDTYVLEHRGEIVSDVLIILAAWISAGKPTGDTIKGSFQRWASVMSGVLAFVGAGDFLKNETESGTFLDPESAKWSLFARRVFETHGQTSNKASDLCELAAEAEIIADAGDRGASRSLGKMLQKNRERVFGGLKLITVSGHNNTLRFSFRSVDTKKGASVADLGALGAVNGGFGGSGGFSPKPTHDPLSPIPDNANKGARMNTTETTQITQTTPNEKETTDDIDTSDLDDPFADDPKAAIDDNRMPEDPFGDGPYYE